jgi:hypothetical protein
MVDVTKLLCTTGRRKCSKCDIFCMSPRFGPQKHMYLRVEGFKRDPLLGGGLCQSS